jgi:4-oxalocrotonate tautomerase
MPTRLKRPECARPFLGTPNALHCRSTVHSGAEHAGSFHSRRRGRSIEQKRKLVAEITDAVVRNFNVSADAVMVEIIESSRDNKAKGGKLFSER